MFTVQQTYLNEQDFLKETITWVNANRVSNSYLVLGGDMNCVEYPTDRSSHVLDKTSESLKILKNLRLITDTFKH